MIEQSFEVKTPVSWLPAGLISWYDPGGLPVVLVTSWVALVGGEHPRIRTAWHGCYDPLSCFWTGGDFVLNVPHEVGMEKVRNVMLRGKICPDAEKDLNYSCVSGLVSVAPLLLDCAVQIECVDGRLVDSGPVTELCGDVVRMHRDQVTFDPADIPDLCAVNPLTPSMPLR